ncbi:hypothetical protein K1720_01220 [Thermococcus argininiproducens]|uniref:Uncharacterized protein n=1 Tax=Thermococcus argininiproducens TaxID=2866384 RepID=A0A9E7MAF1_9EURY|nr:hypothetical protein [Thermococcus argininiproducens]USH00134.1 hypothetical protein K1720_01220 [Thermococcus argininiproducens]
MRKPIVILILIFIAVAGLVYFQNSSRENKERIIKLKATFRMGGAIYKGYEMREDTLVFKFERKGDFFTQAIETKEVTTGEKLSPKRVIMEVTTNGETKTYEAKFIDESEEIALYEASELE